MKCALNRQKVSSCNVLVNARKKVMTLGSHIFINSVQNKGKTFLQKTYIAT